MKVVKVGTVFLNNKTSDKSQVQDTEVHHTIFSLVLVPWLWWQFSLIKNDTGKPEGQMISKIIGRFNI